jgi:hypothetical protein
MLAFYNLPARECILIAKPCEALFAKLTFEQKLISCIPCKRQGLSGKLPVVLLGHLETDHQAEKGAPW